MQNDGMIVCSALGKKYGDQNALKGIDLTVEKGDFMAVFGPNGAGKSTLFKILCGLIHPTSGSASVAGADARDPEVRKKIGFISHKSFIYDRLTAMENITFYAELYGVDKPGKRAEELLESVELAKRKNDLAAGFSRGMLQRLSIARALVADPDFIFLDEPFTGLDLHSANIFKNLLVELHSRKKTVMMITHDISIGFSIATRGIILFEGNKVYDRPTHGMTVEEFKSDYIRSVGA